MNTGCFKCSKAQWDADGCTCEITGRLVGNVARGCEYRKDIGLKPCPFCGSVDVKVHIPYFTDDCYMVQCYGCNCNTAIYMTADQAAGAWNRRNKNEQN